MTSKHWNQDQPFILVSAQHYRKLNKTSDSSHSLHHCAAGAILKKHKEGMSSYLCLSWEVPSVFNIHCHDIVRIYPLCGD